MKKKSFDAVAFMRKRREEIDVEDQGQSWVEKRKRTRRIIEKDPIWQRLKDRVARSETRHAAVHEKPDSK
ncbi:MAG: hypothetical protein V2A74_03690 [bacterium]